MKRNILCTLAVMAACAILVACGKTDDQISVSYTHLDVYKRQLLDCLTFKLGEYNADIQHGPAHRGRSIKLFRG